MMHIKPTYQFVETQISGVSATTFKSSTEVRIIWDYQGLFETAEYTFGESYPKSKIKVHSCGNFTLGFQIQIPLSDENLLACRMGILDVNDRLRFQYSVNDLRQAAEEIDAFTGTVSTTQGDLLNFPNREARIVVELLYSKESSNRN